MRYGGTNWVRMTEETEEETDRRPENYNNIYILFLPS